MPGGSNGGGGRGGGLGFSSYHGVDVASKQCMIQLSACDKNLPKPAAPRTAFGRSLEAALDILILSRWPPQWSHSARHRQAGQREDPASLEPDSDSVGISPAHPRQGQRWAVRADRLRLHTHLQPQLGTDGPGRCSHSAPCKHPLCVAEEP